MERGGRSPPMTTWHHLALRMVPRGEIDSAEAVKRPNTRLTLRWEGRPRHSHPQEDPPAGVGGKSVERKGRSPPMTTWHNLTSPSEWSPAGNLEPYLDGCSTPCSIGSKLLAVASNHFFQIKGSSC